jgi:peptidoglycan/xylan/chitin deacetylase (PgdA/CDA1 family)
MSENGSQICLTFDFDAMCVWPALGLSSPTALSRGEFGARVAVPRILALLERERVTATFYTPGHTVDTYPDLCRRIRDLGHEFGHHGYFHESPISLEEAEERAVLERGLEAFDRALDLKPVGYRSPAWDLSANTTRLLVEYGFIYDSSMMAQDYELYRCRVGDVLHRDRAFEFGNEVDLVEVPVSWWLDDFPQFEFIVSPPVVLSGLGDPEAIQRRWLAELDFMVEEIPDGVFSITFHPQVIGRGARLRILETLINRAKEHGMRFSTVANAVMQWRAENPL